MDKSKSSVINQRRVPTKSPAPASTKELLVIVWSQLTFQEQELLLPKLLSVMPTWHCWKDIGLRLWLQILFEKAGLQP